MKNETTLLLDSNEIVANPGRLPGRGDYQYVVRLLS